MNNPKNQIEIVADQGNLLGEGPLWDHREKCLLWVDIEKSTIYRHDPERGAVEEAFAGVPAAGIGLHASGGLVIAGREGVWLLNAGAPPQSLVRELESERFRFNDMVAAPNGGIYGGTLHWGEGGMERTGNLYYVSPDCSVVRVDEGVELSNGLAFSPDGALLYYTDSAKRLIYSYRWDPETGALADKRVVVRVPGDEGIPDGMAVDSEGYLWSAQWYGGQVVRYDPEGKVERRISVPVQQVSSVAFGGAELTTLYITSAANSWPSRLAPEDYDFDAPNMGGALYRVETGIRGLHEHVSRLRSGAPG